MKHARLSASSAHRWMVCAGSVAASAGRGTSSFYAAEGTFAHDIAAKCLEDSSLSPSDFLCKRATIDGHEVECGLEMIEAIRVYLDAIDGDLAEGDQCWIEMPLLKALQKIDKDFGGTADYVRYRPSVKELRVVDFKYGSGTFVEPQDNPQLKKYALGALLEVLEHGHTVLDVEAVIVQPRFEGAAPIRTWKFRAVDLLDFAVDLKEAAEKTRLPNPPLVAGDHCSFCPAASLCPELEKKHHALVASEFASLDAVTPQRLASALLDIPTLKERIQAVEEHAYTLATKGVEIPGYKLVDKIARRKWKSEGEVIMWAQEKGLDPYAPREVVSPAQMEEKLKATAAKGKKKDAGKVLEQFVERISSGTALVPLADNRPPAKRIEASDFSLIS